MVVKTRHEVDLDYIRQDRPDHVIVATGARPYRPDLELDGDMPVLDAWDVIGANGDDTPKGHVVVADWRGDWTGLGVAEMVARLGRKVTLCVNGYAAGESLQQYTRIAMLRAATEAKVQIVPHARLFGADDDTVYMVNTLTDEPIILDGVDGLVLALGHRQDDGLVTALESAGIPFTGVGTACPPAPWRKRSSKGSAPRRLSDERPGTERCCLIRDHTDVSRVRQQRRARPRFSCKALRKEIRVTELQWNWTRLVGVRHTEHRTRSVPTPRHTKGQDT